MKLFSRRIERINSNIFIVKYDSETRSRFRYGTQQAKLEFADDYAGAIHSALSLVETGHLNVTVVHHREVIHTHEELVANLAHSNPTLFNVVRLLDQGGSVSQLWAVAS